MDPVVRDAPEAKEEGEAFTLVAVDGSRGEPAPRVFAPAPSELPELGRLGRGVQGAWGSRLIAIASGLG